MKNNVPREILCATDLEHDSLSTENLAYIVAQKLGCRLRLIHVDSSLEQVKFYQTYASRILHPATWEKLSREIMADKARMLRHRIHAMGIEAMTDVTFDVLTGSPAKEILKFVQQSRQKFEMIILGKRKRSFFSEFFLGSVANEIVTRSPLPTLLVPDNDDQFINWRLNQLTVASDMQPGSITAVQFAARLAADFCAKLKLVHVLAVRSSYGSSAFAELNPADADDLDLFFATAEGQVQNYLDKKAKELGLASDRISTEVLYGKTLEVLLNEMKFQNDGILVIGKHNGIDEARDNLDSITSSLARTARFPLLIVPHAPRIAKGAKL